MTLFFRVLDVPVDDKSRALLEAIRGFSEERTFARSHERLSKVPGSPFAYWLPDSALALFVEAPRLGGNKRFARVGMGTLDNFQFLRLWFESSLDSSWIPYANGGRFVRYLFDSSLVVNWISQGRAIKTFVEQRVGSASRKVQSESLFFREGVTWPLRASAFCPQILPRDCIFSARGQTLFAETREELLALTALGSSAVFDFLFKVMLGRFGFPEFLAGGLERMPFPNVEPEMVLRLADLARQGWSVARQAAGTDETHRFFLLPTALISRLQGDTDGFLQSSRDLQAEVDDAALKIFDLARDDVAGVSITGSAADLFEGEADPIDEQDPACDASETESLRSWLVGVAFARFDLRLATGERAIPPEPEPFDPLPSRPPGMYPEGQEPADRPDILVDDEGHADDLAGRAVALAERLKVGAPENLRAWLTKEFFPLHVKMYSKSRRKAPIYWQLATPTSSYSVWLYIHAFSKDTLFRVQNDYVAPKLAHEERRLEALSSEPRDGATATQRKELAAQETLVEDLRTFLDEVKRVAPLWKPNLDDGVIINFAPLWRLVPQHKAWQKELKATWAALCEGKYDWTHLAMHLWPERVVPKCSKDRSLAIAHGLENVFWIEGADGKWTARKTPTKSVDELVKERTSSAVKAALNSLLEAPMASGKTTGRNSGGRRKAAAAIEGGDA